jgi:signal transduction histidine kinase
MLAGLLASRLLTRRLRALAGAMARFEQHGFRTPEPAAPSAAAPLGGDELDELTRAFGAMAARIGDQLATLARVDESRRELVMNISHDLKTPLATLQGCLETLLIRWDRLAPE